MSKKNCDRDGRVRTKTCAFRVSPKEYEQIELAVSLSGMMKQDYLLNKALDRQIVIQGNCKVHRAVCDRLDALLVKLQALNDLNGYHDYLSADIKMITQLIKQLYSSGDSE